MGFLQDVPVTYCKTKKVLSTKEEDFENAFEDNVIGLYFFAAWAPPCAEFTPKLATMYEQLKQRNALFEVIVCSCDKTEDAMNDQIEKEHKDWLYLPFGHPVIETITEKYSVTMIPKLILISSSGKVLSTKGRKEVEDRGLAAFYVWNTTLKNLQDKQEIVLTPKDTDSEIIPRKTLKDFEQTNETEVPQTENVYTIK